MVSGSPLHRAVQHGFYARPSAHRCRLFKPASGGRIFRSSDIVRFVQGGVVKTFRCANLALEHFEPEYRIDRKAREIISTSLVSKRLIDVVTEAALLKLLEDDRLIVYENHSHDALNRISPDDYAAMLRDKWRDHIADTDDFDLQDYTDGYCYTGEFWKGYNGIPIVILYCHH